MMPIELLLPDFWKPEIEWYETAPMPDICGGEATHQRRPQMPIHDFIDSLDIPPEWVRDERIVGRYEYLRGDHRVTINSSDDGSAWICGPGGLMVARCMLTNDDPWGCLNAALEDVGIEPWPRKEVVNDHR